MEKITPDDIRYPDLAGKRFNKRFTGKPEYISLPTSTKEVVEAVQEAVNSKRRLVVRSGGHCLEGFVSDPAVQVLIDMSLMTDIGYDTERSAFTVEAGATVGEMYRRLFLGWGVVLPAGEHPGIGMGGHVAGGAFGFLCREYGLAADYLYGIELVTVDASGKANSVIATREAADPNRELWWAHTGGGAGNFGIVTRFWFRSPEAKGSDPAAAGWGDPEGEVRTLAWLRGFYKDLFAGSGGVPLPNEQTDGCMINHPDTDIADPEWNKSGVPWYTLYYKENYPRLQQVKSKWDPLNIFHHALSIQAGG